MHVADDCVSALPCRQLLLHAVIKDSANTTIPHEHYLHAAWACIHSCPNSKSSTPDVFDETGNVSQRCRPGCPPTIYVAKYISSMHMV